CSPGHLLGYPLRAAARALNGLSCQLGTQWVRGLIRLRPKLGFYEYFQMAGGLGFEPRLTESESAVLPLNYPPIGKSNQIRSGMDQASQSGPGSLATTIAADRRNAGTSMASRAGFQAAWAGCPASVVRGGSWTTAGRPCAKTARLSA